MTTTKDTTAVLECGHVASEHGEHTTGYGTDENGNRYCWECCAKRDREQMRTDGRITLYLTEIQRDVTASTLNPHVLGQRFKVTNWPGSLSLPVQHIRKGRHNMARVRYDIWFSFEGTPWHGVQYGDNTQLCHCSRVKP